MIPTTLKYRGQLYRLAGFGPAGTKLTQEFEAAVTMLLEVGRSLGSIIQHYPTRHIKTQPTRNSQLTTEFLVRATPGTEATILGKFKAAVKRLGYDAKLTRGIVSFGRYPGNEGPYEGEAGFYDNSMYVRFHRYDSALSL